MNTGNTNPLGNPKVAEISGVTTPTAPQDDFERFRDLASKLVRAPKTEVHTHEPAAQQPA